jgi:hypothetical protein
MNKIYFIIVKLKTYIFHMNFNGLNLHKCLTFTKLVRSRFKCIKVYLNFNFPTWLFKIRTILSFAKLPIQVAGEVNKGCLLFQKIKQVEWNIHYLSYPCHAWV